MTATFVIDCSAAMAWCFPDERTPASLELFRRAATESVCVPSIWFIEVANVLSIAQRKGWLTAAGLAQFQQVIEDLSLDIDAESSGRAFTHLLPLCPEHRLTSYDAVYLDLAIRKRLPLATRDVGLRKAALKLGVKVIGD